MWCKVQNSTTQHIARLGKSRLSKLLVICQNDVVRVSLFPLLLSFIVYRWMDYSGNERLLCHKVPARCYETGRCRPLDVWEEMHQLSFPQSKPGPSLPSACTVKHTLSCRDVMSNALTKFHSMSLSYTMNQKDLEVCTIQNIIVISNVDGKLNPAEPVKLTD